MLEYRKHKSNYQNGPELFIEQCPVIYLLCHILETGFYISFAGNITYESGRAEASKEIPLNRLLLETDSPYMTPVPVRDKKDDQKKIWRNEPSNVKITAKYHANLREISFEDVVDQTTVNVKALFSRYAV